MYLSRRVLHDFRPKKKLWQDFEKWVHDRYQETQQAPKSREEIVAVYGYDIRQHDRPPKPPRRGYGSDSINIS